MGESKAASPPTLDDPVATQHNFLRPRGSPTLLFSIVLFIGTVILYLPALGGSFLNYDDPAYVTENAHVLCGPFWHNIVWAWTATVESNWHPLTWISHMADVQFFGLNPKGHHLVSILLHALNVVLLFLLLQRVTGYLLRTAAVATLFAVHPLNVECVAWIAERKSLLSMLFLLLTLHAYVWYERQRNLRRYLVVAALFALGLAAKPMVVTLPLLLLLWDYWPLRNEVTTPQTLTPRSPLYLVLEKLPLLAMSAASAWITVYAQHRGGALVASELLPWGLRLKNAIYSYVAYLGKGIWPSGLAVFYPHPANSLATWKVLAAALLILTITSVMWILRQRPYLLVGWLWYLIAMLPMIGIVQVGRQALADRYAYLPFIGLFLIAVWGTAELFDYLRLSTSASVAITSAVLLAYASATFLQLQYWHNSYSLFSHAVKVTNRNAIAEDNLAAALMDMGRPDLAVPHFEAALQYDSHLSTTHYNLGVLLQRQNRLDASQHEYELALEYGADAKELAQTHNNLGVVLAELNNPSAAKKEFTAALQINPDKQNSLVGRGILSYRQGDLDSALADFTRAAQIAPNAQADFWLGRALEDKGQLQAAAAAYAASLRLAPAMKEAQQRLDAIKQKLH